MAKICVTEQTARRQRWIENGLLELLQQKKYASVSVTDLCKHLQLSRRSFYRYFDDLDDVIDSIVDHSFQDLAVVSLRPSIEDLQRCFEYWMERRIVLDALYQCGYFEKLFVYALHYTDFVSVDAFDRDMIQEYDARVFVIGGFMSLTMSWVNEGFRRSPEEMAQFGYKMLYEPFINNQ